LTKWSITPKQQQPKRENMKEVIKELIEVGDRAFQVPILEYSDMKEMQGHATEATIVQKLNNFLHAHGSFSDGRDLIVDVTNELTKVPYLMKKTDKKDSKGNVIEEWAETAKTYVNRALTVNKKVSFDDVQKEVTRRARGYIIKDAEGKEVKIEALAVDLRKRESVAKPRTLAQKFKDNAVEFLTGKKSLEKFSKAFQNKFSEPLVLPNTKTLSDPLNIEALGWALKRWDMKFLEELEAKRAAEQAKEFAI
jgi:hypothetical protein